MSARATTAPTLAVVGLILAAHLSLAPNIADADSFYHIGHAAHYLANGPFDTSFPWATLSAVADYGADLWWGFHVALLPFAWLDDAAMGIRLAAVLLTAVLAGVVWWALARHQIAHAGWWTFAFLCAVPNVLFRYLMVRPHVLSLAAGIALLSLLARGRPWQLVAVAAAITWLHLSLFWMAPGIVAAWIIACVLTRAPEGAVPAVRAVAAVLAGSALGWVLRPHPLAAAELAYIQIVQLAAEKASDLPLSFAVELRPLPWAELVRFSWLFLAGWALACGVAVRSLTAGPSTMRIMLVTCVSISTVFLAITVISARRGLVEAVAFGSLALPFAFALLPAGSRRRLAVVAVPLIAVHLPWSAHRHRLNTELVAFRPDALAEVAAWLASNTEPGEVVFHAHWDNFGPLFARNRTSRYVGGMDPIFQYAHDRGLYWEYFYLSEDLIQEYTCDAFPCYEGTATGTHAAIRDHFRARSVVVEPRRNPKLTLHLLRDPGFVLALETPREAVFLVVDVPARSADAPASAPASDDRAPSGQQPSPGEGTSTEGSAGRGSSPPGA